MGMSREDLSLVPRLETESIFIYYLTGTLTLVFFITVFITRSLQRTQPIVTELIHDSNITEELVTCLISVETSIWPGSGCPSGVKVYMQLLGMNNTSQYFLLQSNGSSKAILQRGFTDIFLVKIPVSVGPLSCVKFILSGLEGPLKWKIRNVELHLPFTGTGHQLLASIVIAERCEPNTHHKVEMVKKDRSVLEKLFVYHQWLGQFGNTMRYGAFTAVTHVLCVFTTLATLLDLTLITYISLPEGDSLVSLSLLIGTICPAFGYCLLLFLIEIVLRNVRSMIKSPGNAYYTVCGENKNLNAVSSKTEPSKYTCLLSENDFETPFVWDSNFETITSFLTKFLEVINSKSASVFVETGDLNNDMFVSAYDITEDNVPTLYIPKYSGIALNHLLSDRNSQGDVKGSSLFNLIHENQSYASTQSCISFHSEHDSNKASGLVINLLSESAEGNPMLNDTMLVKKESSRFVNDCSINSSVFWRQYKQQKHTSRHQRNVDDLSLSMQDSERELKNEMGTRYQQDRCNIELKSDINLKNSWSVINQKIVQNRKHSNLAIDNEIHVERKSDSNLSDETYFVLDFTGTIVEDDIRLDLSKQEDLHDNRNPKSNLHDDEVKLDLVAEEVKLDLDSGEDNLDLLVENVDKPNEEVDKLNDVQEENRSVTKSASEGDAGDYISAQSSDNSIISEGSNSVDINSVTWESIHKSRSRKLVTDICKFYRQVRIQIIEGEVISILPVMIGWFDDVISSVVMSCFAKSQSHMEDLTEKMEIVNLAMYMSGEIILFTINQVYKSLKSDNMDLPDIVVQSHHMMLAVEEAAYSILFALNNEFLDSDQLEIVRSMEMQRYVCHICTEFLKHSFQLIVHANELTWAYFEIYLLQTLRNSIDCGTFHNLMQFISENLQFETEETVILQKLCKTAIEEAKCEVWEEYHDEKNMFMDMTVKQDILAKLTLTINQLFQRKIAFDKEYKLRAKPPKSRLQVLAEKRKKVNQDEIRKRLKRDTSLEKWTLWQRETGSQNIPTYKELIQHSVYLDKGALNVKWVKEQVEKRWTRLGLKKQTHGLPCLVHSLIYSHTGMENFHGESKFKDYLQVKRVENQIKEFIETVLDDLSQYVVISAVDEYSLMDFPDQVHLKLSVEDVCIRVDTVKDLLLKELETIAEYAVDIERNRLTMDKNLIESTTHFIIKKSSSLLKCAPSVTDKFMTTKRSDKTTSMCDHTARRYDMDYKAEPSKDLTEASSDLLLKQNEHGTSVETLVVTMGDLKTELMLIQLFLKNFTQTEKLRSQCTLHGYFEQQKQKCSRIANIALHNIIDSYYIIEEGDDSHTFTKAGLYQIEYDMMGESKKKLPTYVKPLLTGCLLLIILSSFVLVTLIGSQFDTTQNQEYVCYYLVSILQFALLFEPFRAIAVASLCRRK